MSEDAAYLFDTDALSEPLKKRPLAEYIAWLDQIPFERQFTSAVAVGELFAGAFRQRASPRHLNFIEEGVLTNVSVVPFDTDVARVYGRLDAELRDAGQVLAEPDLQIAATAVHYDLELVTGNLRHFERVPGLRLCRMFADARH